MTGNDGHDRGRPLGAWNWRDAPADGGRDYGNANVFATPSGLTTLVRETGQNSLDAAVNGVVTMRYRFVELSRDSDAYEAFVRDVDLDGLLGHVEAASSAPQKFGSRLRDGLRRVRDGDRLTLLRIDDYGTTGLFGTEYPEGEVRNPFAAMMRNNLDSAKSSGSAGGSFGLGKAVAWNCSLLFTVLSASEPVDRPPGTEDTPTRFIGKSELTWHQVGGEAFAGPGWYSARDPRFASVWTTPERLSNLQLDRRELPDGVDPAEASGTSLLVLGFHDPAQQGEPDGEKIVAELAEAAATHFWPAMLHRQLRVVVEHAIDGDVAQRVDVRPDRYVPSFCSAYEAYQDDALAEQGGKAGEVLRRAVPLTVMPTRDDQTTVRPVPEEVVAETHLVVRLAEKEGAEDERLLDHVALVRGRRMVVKYLAQRNVLIGGFPFHGVLLAGEAAKEAPHAHDAEEFLRAAEPPAHDEWAYNSDLKAIYRVGTGARLQEFFRGLRETLRQMVRRPDGDERIGPVELRRLLEAKTEGAPGSSVMASLSSPHAQVDGDAWKVRGEVKVVRKDVSTRVRPRLRLEVESGRSLHLSWGDLDWSGASEHGVDDDGPWCIVTPPTRRVTFEGVSANSAQGVPATASRLRVELEAEMVHDA